MFEQIGNRVRRVDGDGVFGDADLEIWGKEGLKSGDNVGWDERRAIGEFDTGAELELPVAHAGIVGPFGGESGLKSAVVVEGQQAVIDEDGELLVLRGGKGAGLPFARVERNRGGAKDNAQSSAVNRALGGARWRCHKRAGGENANQDK